MIFRKLTQNDRTQAEAVWIEIFEESPAFASYYFDRRFHPEHSFGAFEGDRMAAMAQGRPTEIIVEGKTYPAMLVAGVSTLPEFRRQGLMHRLMTMLIEHAKESGYACCYLHPVTETLYTSLGFQNGADILTVHSDPDRSHEAFVLKEELRADEMLSVYHTLQQTHDGMQVRDEAELLTVFADYAIDGGKVLIASREGRPYGYIIYCSDGLVYELMALSPAAYACLLDEAAARVGKEIKAMAPVDCGLCGERHYSMQYLVFDGAFSLPLKNGFCRLAY